MAFALFKQNKPMIKIYVANENLTPTVFQEKIKGIFDYKTVTINGVDVRHFKEIYSQEGMYFIDKQSRIWNTIVKKDVHTKNTIGQTDFHIDSSILEKKEVYHLPSNNNSVDKESVVYEIIYDKNVNSTPIKLYMEYIVDGETATLHNYYFLLEDTDIDIDMDIDSYLFNINKFLELII
jgi:hypothetical protein